MSKESIIKAWKNPEYRKSLSASQRAGIPENPAGVMTLSDDELERVAGGARIIVSCFCTFSGDDCPKYTDRDWGGACTVPCTTSLACPLHCGQTEPL
jgi:mersacidin/lichenicidin family type 2 lantibiotic